MTTNILPGGFVTLQLQFTAAPTNDLFANRTKLTGSRAHVNANNYAASNEPGEPDKMGNPGGSSSGTLDRPRRPPGNALHEQHSALSAAVLLRKPGWVVSEFEILMEVFRRQLRGLSIRPSRSSLPAEMPLTKRRLLLPIFPCSRLSQGRVSALTPANCLPVALSGYPYAIEFDALKGHAYQIAVDGNMGTTGDITLYLASDASRSQR